MRVIAGSARSLLLVAPTGLGTRPTTDRIKETLFNMIQPHLYGCNFLDLFSGSGAIGIEALSRGASHATFIEKDTEAINCINRNLQHTKLYDKSTILPLDYQLALERLNKDGKQFDIIFVDPPYDKLIESQVLEFLSKSNIVHENTLIIVEARVGTQFDYVEKYGFHITHIKDYKTNIHVFLKK